MGHAQHGLLTELHGIAPLRTDHLPGIPLRQPGVGAFTLSLWADGLPENAEFIANSIADGRQLKTGQ